VNKKWSVRKKEVHSDQLGTPKEEEEIDGVDKAQGGPLLISSPQ